MRELTCLACLVLAVLGSISQQVQPLISGHLVYDEARQRLLMIGAYRPPSAPERVQVWTLEASGWLSLPAAPAPPMRTLSAAVYDSRRQRVILHGGLGNTGLADPRGDTWEWDGDTWSQVSDAAVDNRDHHSMAFDEARGRAVIYGGMSSVGGSDQKVRNPAASTAEWDGTRWTHIATPGPGPRGGAGMVFDRARTQIVLFGGVSMGPPAVRYHDTWLWDGKQWRKASDEGPAGRNGAAIVFDRGAGVVLMWGGTTGASHLDDLWQWNGQRWSEVVVSGTRPGPRVGAQMVYSTARQRVLLFGGRVRENGQVRESNELWEWDGMAWRLLAS